MQYRVYLGKGMRILVVNVAALIAHQSSNLSEVEQQFRPEDGVLFYQPHGILEIHECLIKKGDLARMNSRVHHPTIDSIPPNHLEPGSKNMNVNGLKYSVFTRRPRVSIGKTGVYFQGCSREEMAKHRHFIFHSVPDSLPSARPKLATSSTRVQTSFRNTDAINSGVY